MALDSDFADLPVGQIGGDCYIVVARSQRVARMCAVPISKSVERGVVADNTDDVLLF